MCKDDTVTAFEPLLADLAEVAALQALGKRANLLAVRKLADFAIGAPFGQ